MQVAQTGQSRLHVMIGEVSRFLGQQINHLPPLRGRSWAFRQAPLEHGGQAVIEAQYLDPKFFGLPNC